MDREGWCTSVHEVTKSRTWPSDWTEFNGENWHLNIGCLCLSLCDPIDCSTPGLTVHHQLPTPLSRSCHPTISSSVIAFSSCLQSFPASGSFQMSQLFALCGQRTGVSASPSVLPMNTQDWFPLGWTGWISLQSKGLSRVFSNTTVQKHQFFGTQLSFPGDSDGKGSACNAGDPGSVPGLGRFPGEGIDTHSSIHGLPGGLDIYF